MTKAKLKKSKRADRAYLKAVEEIEKDRIEEIKVIVKQVLEGIMGAQKDRKAADEKLFLLKRDLDDIRQGKIEKIKERHARAKEEKKWVPFEAEKLQGIFDRYIPNTGSGNRVGIVTTIGTTTFGNSPITLGHAATTGPFVLSDGSQVSVPILKTV